jgi:hypothetical protein
MPLSLDRLEDRVLVGPEAIQEMEDQMKTIRHMIKEAQDWHKSFVDAHCVDRSYCNVPNLDILGNTANVCVGLVVYNR